MSLIDFHVHIDFYDNSQEILEKYEANKIYSLFVTNLPEIFQKHLLKYSHYKYVKLALGYHPEMVNNYDFNKMLFDIYYDFTNYIGEIGLDFSDKNELNRKKQVEAFEYICSKEHNNHKIYSIHSKKSEEKVLEILIKNNVKFAVFHWYSGKLNVLQDIINCGYYFSVNYNMLSSKSGCSILNKIPLERILFETDGPFIRKDRKILTPLDISSIYDEFNTFYNISNFEDIVYSNFRKLITGRIEEEKKSTKSFNIQNVR